MMDDDKLLELVKLAVQTDIDPILAKFDKALEYQNLLRASHAELLAAAREVLSAWEDESGMGTIYSMGRVIPSVRAAIAKAEELGT